MHEPTLENQLLGLSAKAKATIGPVVAFAGASTFTWYWERGWFVGAGLFLLVIGVLIAWTGTQELARERTVEGEIDRALGEWEELERDVTAARREGRSVARYLQQRGYREFTVRRWIASELGSGSGSGSGSGEG